MNISKRMKILLIGLLVLLNVVIRIPSVPHEYGFDSFTIHTLANTISIFGEARWWIHPLSVIGIYPYSYASVVPFILSGISQCTGMDMELVIRLYGTIIGVFSAFTAYLLAGMIKNDDLFKFLVAFCFSVSPGVLVFSTWDATTRGFFIILLPLFIYVLLKTRTFRVRCGLLTIALFMVLLATHHYIYLTIPVILSFFIVVILGRFVKLEEVRSNFANIGYLALFFILFAYPFFAHTFITAGSRYDWLWTMLHTNVRYSGILFAFSVSGFVYLSFKRNKELGEWFILTILLFIALSAYQLTYTHYFATIFLLILACFALANVAKANKRNRKVVALVIIISLLLAVSFSGFYQHWRTHMHTGAKSWYMGETTNAGGLWIKDNINPNKHLIGNGGVFNNRAKRMNAISGSMSPILTPHNTLALSVAYVNESYIKMRKNSPLTTAFYRDNPYVEIRRRSMGHQINRFSSISNIDGGDGERFIKRFNLSYVVEDTNINDPVIRSVREKKNNIYDGGEIRIWDLGRGG